MCWLRRTTRDYDYEQATKTLTSVLRYADEGSSEAAQAVAQLPAWTYWAALDAFGKGVPAEGKQKLADLGKQFPGTTWAGPRRPDAQEHRRRPQGHALRP